MFSGHSALARSLSLSRSLSLKHTFFFSVPYQRSTDVLIESLAGLCVCVCVCVNVYI